MTLTHIADGTSATSAGRAGCPASAADCAEGWAAECATDRHSGGSVLAREQIAPHSRDLHVGRHPVASCY